MKAQDIVDFVKRHTTPCVSFAIIVVTLIVAYFRMDVNTELEGKYQTVSAEGATVMNNIVNGSGLQEHVKTIRAQSSELESRMVRPAELAKNLEWGELSGVEFRRGECGIPRDLDNTGRVFSNLYLSKTRFDVGERGRVLLLIAPQGQDSPLL